MNLPYLAYCYLLGLEVEKPRSFEEGVKWIDEDRDLRSSLEYRNRGSLSLSTWVKSYRGKRTYAIAAKDDWFPILCFLGRLGGAFARRIRGLLVKS